MREPLWPLREARAGPAAEAVIARFAAWSTARTAPRAGLRSASAEPTNRLPGIPVPRIARETRTTVVSKARTAFTPSSSI